MGIINKCHSAYPTIGITGQPEIDARAVRHSQMSKKGRYELFMQRDHTHRSRVVRKNVLACIRQCLQWLFRFNLLLAFPISSCWPVSYSY